MQESRLAAKDIQLQEESRRRSEAEQQFLTESVSRQEAEAELRTTREAAERAKEEATGARMRVKDLESEREEVMKGKAELEGMRWG